MASEAISEDLILKIFLGEHATRPPYHVCAYALTIISTSPILSTFCHLWITHAIIFPSVAQNSHFFPQVASDAVFLICLRDFLCFTAHNVLFFIVSQTQ